MVTVKVIAEQGRYAAVIHNDRINYTRIGEEFEAGQPVNGRFEGEVRAEADASDWRYKLAKAGLDVEPARVVAGQEQAGLEVT